MCFICVYLKLIYTHLLLSLIRFLQCGPLGQPHLLRVLSQGAAVPEAGLRAHLLPRLGAGEEVQYLLVMFACDAKEGIRIHMFQYLLDVQYLFPIDVCLFIIYIYLFMIVFGLIHLLPCLVMQCHVMWWVQERRGGRVGGALPIKDRS